MVSSIQRVYSPLSDEFNQVMGTNAPGARNIKKSSSLKPLDLET